MFPVKCCIAASLIRCPVSGQCSTSLHEQHRATAPHANRPLWSSTIQMPTTQTLDLHSHENEPNQRLGPIDLNQCGDFFSRIKLIHRNDMMVKIADELPSCTKSSAGKIETGVFLKKEKLGKSYDKR